MASKNSIPNIDSLVTQLTEAVNSYKSIAADLSSANESAARRLVADAAKNIITVTVTKGAEEELLDWCLRMVEMPVLRLFIKWGVFDAIPTEGSITFTDLAAVVKIEESLLTRLSNALTASGILIHTPPNSISHSLESVKYCSGNPYAIIYPMVFDEALVSYAQWPAYFDKYGPAEPTLQNHVPHSFAYGHPEMTCFEVMSLDPARCAVFQKCMSLFGDMMPITGMYDFSWLAQYAGGDRPLIVDVGGGKGQALKAFLNETPGLQKGVSVVQDRQEVIDIVKAEDTHDMKNIQYMVTDFFEPQPVKNAYIYFVRRILHDWSDQQSTRILQHLCDAMGTDSRVLICEQLMTDPPTALNVQADLMMLNIGGKERNQKCFEKITQAAGLKIVKIHRLPNAENVKGGEFAMIECAKA